MKKAAKDRRKVTMLNQTYQNKHKKKFCILIPDLSVSNTTFFDQDAPLYPRLFKQFQIHSLTEKELKVVGTKGEVLTIPWNEHELNV